MLRAILPILIIGLSFNISNGQSFNIDDVNGTTLNLCTGSLFDSGGQFGGYGTTENDIVTICSDGTTGPSIFLDFLVLDIVGTDQLCIFDGDSDSSPLLGCYNNANPNPIDGITASASNPSGCLTVQFFADAAGTGDGFQLGFSCQLPCQQVLAVLDATTPAVVPADTGYIDICVGETVFFSGSGAYPENNFYYNQSDLTTSFEWNFGDNFNNTGFGLNAAHTYNEPGGYIG